ncbi:hypothetical protein EW146_g9328 [Bondarzewia mesenterica]|uniref:NADP-dependent oxidoreductase domain-containing protein n=1 Tax=Bondarzewia mesenterica TaxID=1095465 RepID=A0A4S4L7H8_9AGAM|nr:hypothetical protein EW146_g9328 [Bondarzewia mesenterica]
MAEVGGHPLATKIRESSFGSPSITSFNMLDMAHYRSLGKSGLRVSVPVLGGMAFGSPKWAPWTLDEEKSLEVLKAAWDLGINTIDTANIYSNGESERIIARFISKVSLVRFAPAALRPMSFPDIQYNIPREKIVIMSKAWALVSPDVSVMASMVPGLADTRDYVNQGGLSRTAQEASQCVIPSS